MIILFIALPGLIVFVDFIGFLFKGKHIVGKFLLGLAELGSLIILPYMYAGFGNKNVCCADEIDTATFSPPHQLTIAAIILLCLICYTFSKFRNQISSPILEVIINVVILIGIVLNVFIGLHTTESIYAIFGNLPIILLGILMLVKNQKLFLDIPIIETKTDMNKLELIAWKILATKPLFKFPVLFVLCLPILLGITFCSYPKGGTFTTKLDLNN